MQSTGDQNKQRSRTKSLGVSKQIRLDIEGPNIFKASSGEIPSATVAFMSTSI